MAGQTGMSKMVFKNQVCASPPLPPLWNIKMAMVEIVLFSPPPPPNTHTFVYSSRIILSLDENADNT